MPCSLTKEVYNPKASIPHAASLHQACAHCAIFPTAASRRSLGRISVPMWPVALSGRLPVEAMVGRYPAIKLIGRDPIPCRKGFPRRPCDQLEHPALPPVSRSYSGAWGRSVTHYSPVRHSHHQASLMDPVRLACVKHAASVRPEPESNPPHKNRRKPNTGPQKNKKTTSKTTPHHKAERSLTQTNTHTTPPQQAAQHEHSTGNQKPNQKPHPTKNKGRSLQSDHNLQNI